MYKCDFPVLTNTLSKTLSDTPPLCFLDSGASAQKPTCVLDTQEYFSRKVYANVHRGTYDMSTEITTAYENSRGIVADFINAPHKEIVFTKSVTESLNLVAYSLGSILPAGSEIVVSILEHHANIVPWFLLAKRRDIKIKVCPILEDGTLDYNALDTLVNNNTALVALTHVSNVTGAVTDVQTVVKIAKPHNALVLIDGSQAIMHQTVDVKNLGVDFYAFTGHKLCAPNGVGVLWAKTALLEKMPPFLGGGDMIDTVRFDNITYAPPPAKFEAGTPPIVPVICLGTAVEYIQNIGMDKISAHERQLTTALYTELLKIDGVRILGFKPDTLHKNINRPPIISFVVEGVHAFDIADILNNYGVCVRVGHHCAQPLMNHFGIASSIRVSGAFYNDMADIKIFIQSLQKALKMLRG